MTITETLEIKVVYLMLTLAYMIVTRYAEYEIDIHLKVEEDMIKDIKFEGRGCAISQASASMLTEQVLNKPLNTVKDIAKEDILENIGLMNLGPARIKCALFSLRF